MKLVTYSNFNLILNLLINVTEGIHQRHKWKSMVPGPMSLKTRDERAGIAS
jgi:hypothetical protein